MCTGERSSTVYTDGLIHYQKNINSSSAEKKIVILNIDKIIVKSKHWKKNHEK